MTHSKIQFDLPSDPEMRQPRENRCYELLVKLGIPFTRIDHQPAMTMEACTEIDQTLGCAMCKNLFLCNHQKTAFYLLLLEGNKQFRTASVSKAIGSSRLSFASAEDMQQLLDLQPGSVSLLGLMNDRECKVKLLVDADLLKNDTIGVHPCVNTSSLRLRTKDAFGTFLTEIKHDMTVLTLNSTEEAKQ